MNKEAQNFIKIRGARVHNLKNIDIDIPKNKLVVITGLSGSGKSSLAFDTIYAEAERRYVESLSSYARQFLGVQDKPEVESMDGLSPAISIDQKSVPKNPRSTVGTITEIYDYMRILFARVGEPFCPNCGKKVGRQNTDEIMRVITNLPKNKEILILAPVISGKKGEHKSVLEEIARQGFIKARFDGEINRIGDILNSSGIDKSPHFPAGDSGGWGDKNKKHSLEVVVDRFIFSPDIERSRVRDSVETALKIGKGMVIANVRESATNRTNKISDIRGSSERIGDIVFSENLACVDCGINFPPIEPRTFSFNSPYGACPHCTGLGSTLEVDPSLIIPNKRLTIAEGAIKPWASASHRVRQSWYWWILSDLAERHNFSLNTPFEKLPRQIADIILYGENSSESGIKNSKSGFEGVVSNLKRRWKETDSEWTRAEIEKYMMIKICPECLGSRLQKIALAVKFGGKNIADMNNLTISEAKKNFNEEMLKLRGKNLTIASPLVKEITKRLDFLIDVGLHYITLSRVSTTLAGGEAQRIRLATQIGSKLTGILYILDEPSIGLHPRDHKRLIKTLKDLRDLGNTVIVVEHDAETMKEADWIIDLGPGAGEHGGKIIFEGTPRELLKANTLTGQYLSGKKKVKIDGSKFSISNYQFSNKPQNVNFKTTIINKSQNNQKLKSQKYLFIKGAKEHNLKNIDVKIPLGKFVCVSGVSGSGKSTLINDILAKALLVKFYRAHVFPGEYREILGTENLDKVIVVDQSAIGRTPRSNPATYTGVFSLIRSIFAKTPYARSRGYGPGRFSFNVKGGRCEICEGQGVKKIEMYFLPDVWVECEECRGKRYNQEALEIEYDGKNIADVLDLSIEDALSFFKNIPPIKQKLATLYDVGLGYMKLGQPATTLSGGEAQRTKLATELSRRDTSKTLYILDEPTTGLHFEDINKLLKVLSALVEKGNTVLIIEHNLDVLKNSDWIIDLGPEGGDGGGFIIAEGTPEEIIMVKNSYTGQWLQRAI